MRSSLHTDIQSQIGRVVAGEMTLRAFYRWFVPATWEVEHSGNAEEIRLTHEIAHLFNEYSAGVLTADDVTRSLTPLAEAPALARS